MYTSWSLCSSRVRFRGVWLIVFGFRQTMVNFAMIHSSRVDRVRSRHLGRIRTQKQWQCHQRISLFLDASTKKATNRVCSICWQFRMFLRNANVVERATGAAVIPPTMVKIMTLECHAIWKLTHSLINCARTTALSTRCSCKAEPSCWFGKGSALLSLAMQ